MKGRAFGHEARSAKIRWHLEGDSISLHGELVNSGAVNMIEPSSDISRCGQDCLSEPIDHHLRFGSTREQIISVDDEARHSVDSHPLELPFF